MAVLTVCNPVMPDYLVGRMLLLSCTCTQLFESATTFFAWLCFGVHININTKLSSYLSIREPFSFFNFSHNLPLSLILSSNSIFHLPIISGCPKVTVRVCNQI